MVMCRYKGWNMLFCVVTGKANTDKIDNFKNLGIVKIFESYVFFDETKIIISL